MSNFEMLVNVLLGWRRKKVDLSVTDSWRELVAIDGCKKNWGSGQDCFTKNWGWWPRALGALEGVQISRGMSGVENWRGATSIGIPLDQSGYWEGWNPAILWGKECVHTTLLPIQKERSARVSNHLDTKGHSHSQNWKKAMRGCNAWNFQSVEGTKLFFWTLDCAFPVLITSDCFEFEVKLAGQEVQDVGFDRGGRQNLILEDLVHQLSLPPVQPTTVKLWINGRVIYPMGEIKLVPIQIGDEHFLSNFFVIRQSDLRIMTVLLNSTWIQ